MFRPNGRFERPGNRFERQDYRFERADTELEGDAGKIRNPCEQICIYWDIHQYFSSVPQKADVSITSRDFHFASSLWYLKLYPNGDRRSNTVGFINVYLCPKSSITEEKRVNLTLGIKCHDNSLIERSHVYSFDDKGVHSGLKVIKRCDLLHKRSNLAPGGTLTVVCKARIESSVKEVASQTKCSDGVSSLSEDLKNLFIDENNSDVTIKVKDRKFKVHKLILRSRSSVFSAMFSHDMKENATGTIDIDDCEPEIFHDFLLFLYSGKVEKLSISNVDGLYSLADKYDLEDLMLICLNFMKENLNLHNACRIMAIADRHNEQELRKSASLMIKRNLNTQFVRSPQWITFMAENSVLAAELLTDVLPENETVQTVYCLTPFVSF